MSTTTPAISKSDLLAKVDHGYVASRAVVDALPPERFDEQLPSPIERKPIGSVRRDARLNRHAAREPHSLAVGRDHMA